MKLDALVLGAHPDDAEISFGGTMLRWVDAGLRVGVLDLTRGEMGTRGTVEERDAETRAATQLLGLAWRGNAELPDGRVEPSLPAREQIARTIRELRPDVLVAHHPTDLHPDHCAAGHLARQAWYLSGLARLAQQDGGPEAFRPGILLHFLGHIPADPTFVVDISEVFERKMDVIRCYAKQLEPSGPDDRGQHFLFGADSLARAETKARFFGERIGVRHGEALVHDGPFPLDGTLARLFPRA